MLRRPLVLFTAIRLNIDGDWVITNALQGNTASSVAIDLANKINTHATIKTKVAAVASGSTVFLQSLQQGLDYTYPWQTWCSYPSEYFSNCAFKANLSPIATLAPQE